MNSSTLKKSFISVLIGLAIGAGVTLVTLALFSYIYTKLDLGDNSARVLPMISIAISSFLSGLVSAKIYNQKGLILGLITGVTFFIILTAISLLGSTDDFTSATGLKFVLSLIPSAIGGVVGVNIRKSNKLKNLLKS